jgi:hypothetical protein
MPKSSEGPRTRPAMPRTTIFISADTARPDRGVGRLFRYRGQQISDLDRRELRERVRDSVRQNDPVAMVHRAAGIDDIGDVALTLSWLGPDQRRHTKRAANTLKTSLIVAPSRCSASPLTAAR